jgi:hypothetical protein
MKTISRHNPRFALASLLLALLAACGGGGGSSPPPPPDPGPPAPPAPPPRFPCPGTALPKAALGSFDLAAPPVPIHVDLRTVPLSPIAFTRRDLLSGMNYSYGFAVGDFDCDSRPDVSFFDSFTDERPDRTPPGAIGLVAYGQGTLDTIVPRDAFPELPNNGDFLFERHVTIDVDGDGFQDIAGVLNSNGAVAAYLNSGRRGEAWSRRYLSTATPGPVNIAAGDIDRDGDQDLVVTMRQNAFQPPNAVTEIVWLQNPGSATGTWVQRSIAPIMEGRSLIVADMNGDARLDVVASNNATGRISLFLGDGGTSWQERVLPGVALHGHFGVAVDVNGDGRSEVLQPVFQGIKLLWLDPQTGDVSEQTIATFESENQQILITEVRAADMDGDGRMDVVFTVGSLSTSPTAPRRGGLYWLRQTAGSWEARLIDAGRGSMVGVQLADMDGDGDTDIVSNTEYPLNAVTVHTNTR